jgi:ATP-dependent RNA helicase DeaD
MTPPDDGAHAAADAPAETFADLQIHPAVLQAVIDVGYESPSAIQAATIPALMAG